MQVVEVSPALAQWLRSSAPETTAVVSVEQKCQCCLCARRTVSTIAALDPTCQVVDRTVDVQDEHKTEISQSLIVAPRGYMFSEAPSCGTYEMGYFDLHQAEGF